MIECDRNTFYLQTRASSYWFRVTEYGHLEHLYYGARIAAQDPEALAIKRTAQYGSTIAYDPANPLYCLDSIPLEYSQMGQGDYRSTPIEVVLGNGSRVTDFVYREHRIVQGVLPMDTLPSARGDARTAQTLIVTLGDDTAGLDLDLVYTVFPDVDVISRRCRLTNRGGAAVDIRRLDSLMVDMRDRRYEVLGLDGAWSKETHESVRPVSVGAFTIGSTTGASSNRQNPGFILKTAATTETHGDAFGFNLVYSGNHRSSVELDSFGLLRVQTGINPVGFQWPLGAGEHFETPEAIMSYSGAGLGRLSRNLHAFVRRHIQPERYDGLERPVVYNGWEAMFFDFDQDRQLKLARQAAGLGMELFVVDDGWFVGRRDDTAGLGNYAVDPKKFPQGLGRFSELIHGLGMQFGLWVEPEMVNRDSDLFRAHPDWILAEPGRQPKTGRHQYVLDLCNPEVCDFIVQSVGRVLDEAKVQYVKWDMNRHIADAHSRHVADQGMVAHRYITNLYRVLTRIFEPRPGILLETCSSGGNRFDLGMLCYSAMIWASDDTDPIERLEIQRGLSYLYPLCAISAHVSAAPHQQTLRDTPLSTRFNVACFGALGYEYDLDLLSRDEKAEIRRQVAFYKEHRGLFQFGPFRRHDTAGPDAFQWQVGEGDRAIVGNFQRHVGAAPGPDFLPVAGLDPESSFLVEPRPQRIALDRFGALVQHVLPVKLDPRGAVLRTAGKHYSLPDGRESYRGTGALLEQGIALNLQFIGSYYNRETRLLGDYGSTLYVVRRLKEPARGAARPQRKRRKP